MESTSIRVGFPEQIEDARIAWAVIAAEYRGQWVLCRHRERTTLECPGGRREPGETVEQTARRELYEETGALEYDLTQVCPYGVQGLGGTRSYGMLFYAHVTRLGPLPEGSEMAEVELWEHLPPANWTYPDIQPFLLARIRDTYPI